VASLVHRTQPKETANENRRMQLKSGLCPVAF